MDSLLVYLHMVNTCVMQPANKETIQLVSPVLHTAVHLVICGHRHVTHIIYQAMSK